MNKDELNHQFKTALLTNNYSSMEDLINQGADIHISSQEMIAQAIFSNDLKLSRFLLEHGSSFPIKNANMLNNFANTQNFDIFKLLIEHNNLNVNEDIYLANCIKKNFTEGVEFLFQKGAILKGNHISYAVTRQNLALVNLLLDHGDDIHANGDDAITMASINNNFPIFKTLVENGSNVSIHFTYILSNKIKEADFLSIKYLHDKGFKDHFDFDFEYFGKEKILSKLAQCRYDTPEALQIAQFFIEEYNVSVDDIISCKDMKYYIVDWAEKYKESKEMYSLLNKDLYEDDKASFSHNKIKI